jgi:hypothetical protein
MTFRHLARASAIGLLATGALAVAATPALAADVDFGLDLKGSTLALGVGEKPATVSFANLGTTTPKEVRVQFDATDLKPSIGIDLGDCTFEDGIAECILDQAAIPAPGTTADLDVPLIVEDESATGSQGKLKITVSVDGDTNKANDSKTVDVVLSEKAGADLRVIALDVSQLSAQGQFTGKAIPPGGTSAAVAYIANHGDLAATGLKVAVKLPKDVTFVSKEEGCDYSANMQSVTCSSDEVYLFPWELDSSDNKEFSSFEVPFEVKVSEDAKGPVSLTDGSWTVAALGSEQIPTAKQRAKAPAAKLPAIGQKLTAAEVAEFDVDASDNTDGFSVLVAGPDGGAGGGDGDDDGGLPVTGPVAASVAGAGAAALAVGAFLFISARRRRIVLVTPTDGK